MHFHARDQAALLLCLANGVIGVRDMGHPVDEILRWRTSVMAGTTAGPRIFAAGPILDGPHPVQKGVSVAISSDEEGRNTVLSLKTRGVDFIKVYDLLPRSAYFAVADEAAKQRMPMVGHVPDAISALEASAAGQKSVEHLTGLFLACSGREDELRGELLKFDSDLENHRLSSVEGEAVYIRLVTRMLETHAQKKADALFRSFVGNGTWQCPTLIEEKYFALRADNTLLDEAQPKYVSARMRKMWEVYMADRKQRSPEEQEMQNAKFRKELEIVGEMNKKGVMLLAGADAGNPGVLAGFSLHDELALLVEAGLSPMQSLQAATLNAAKFFGIEGSTGTIQVGKSADVVLLDADPLSDIHNTRRINAVVVNGRFLDRPALDALLEEVSASFKTAPSPPR
jgi:hypothetical protein